MSEEQHGALALAAVCENSKCGPQGPRAATGDGAIAEFNNLACVYRLVVTRNGENLLDMAKGG